MITATHGLRINFQSGLRIVSSLSHLCTTVYFLVNKIKRSLDVLVISCLAILLEIISDREICLSFLLVSYFPDTPAVGMLPHTAPV